MYDKITGDESKFYWRQNEKKQSNTSLIAEGEKSIIVVQQGRFGPKTMASIFFRTAGVKSITYSARVKIIDHKSYIDDCLKHFISTINQKRKACFITYLNVQILQ